MCVAAQDDLLLHYHSQLTSASSLPSKINSLSEDEEEEEELDLRLRPDNSFVQDEAAPGALRYHHYQQTPIAAKAAAAAAGAVAGGTTARRRNKVRRRKAYYTRDRRDVTVSANCSYTTLQIVV